MHIYVGKADAAYRLGSADAYLGRQPLDVHDAGSAVLMDALGETSATTAANYGPRATMCDAYAEGYYDAAGAVA